MKVFSKKEFLKKYQKVPVVEYQNNTSKKPLVSVCVQTFQQVDYIKECLDGILMQKTDFDFEVLLGEDDSSDGTRDVCIEYALQFPDKIKLFLHSRENNIKIYGKPTAKFNVEYNIFNAKGKYLAICEGDDYWTDSLKLQKQVDFLEENIDYGLIYSDIDLIGEYLVGKEKNKLYDGYKRRYTRISKLYKSEFNFWDLLEKNLINTLTVCVKKDLVLDYLKNFSDEIFTYDYRQWLHVASFCKIKFINEKWGSYRVLEQGISNSNSFFDKRSPLVKQAALIHYLSLNNFNVKLFNKRIFSKVTYNILKNKNLSINAKKPIIKLLIKYPIFIIYILKWRIKKIYNRIIISIT